MTRCHVCHEPLSLPNECNYCHEPYCSEHRLPENHQCPQLDAVQSLGPEFRDEFRGGTTEHGTSPRTKIGIGIGIAIVLMVAVVALLVL